jgi:hypothetical protein
MFCPNKVKAFSPAVLPNYLVISAPDLCIPSPLAGEGQGEGESKDRAQSAHHNSKLKPPQTPLISRRYLNSLR